MLAKAICLVIATITNVLAWQPPPASKTVGEKKEQKMLENENGFDTSKAHTFSLMVFAFSVCSCLVHLFLMVKSAAAMEKGPSFFKNNPAVSQVGDLHAWHVVLTLFCVLGYALRKWAYLALDNFFTVSTKKKKVLILF
jgi:hypothetical protein